MYNLLDHYFLMPFLQKKDAKYVQLLNIYVLKVRIAYKSSGVFTITDNLYNYYYAAFLNLTFITLGSFLVDPTRVFYFTSPAAL